ncbi:hypothetical protein J23TS9_40650 [Paenibacillus sp. J23TS9]|uniref:hypothetical protein n=1 Tax=Paenibacillus sp. J23TS9 TaxID=2807193 RepID=UPI001B2A56AC|nr:hypothetical protein [Paenibacillus sp. J23TS9]GIP28935.1 hypothetical protein J23TS9_40650 [Paenibacillus sp. J23TS9]
MRSRSLLEQYKSAILALPQDGDLNKQELLTDAFRMAAEGRITMYYAPHNEWINHAARVVIVGITPGWTQMKTAFQTARAGLAEGLPNEEICRRAKREAGFAGSMRHHLILMLDRLGLPGYLNVGSSAALFREQAQLLHTTSLLRYPVFVDGDRNYTGSSPDIQASPLLCRQALSALEELQEIPGSMLIPLGRAVERSLLWMVDQGQIQEERILKGFPHPSGANGHRQRQFAENEESMRAMLTKYF